MIIDTRIIEYMIAIAEEHSLNKAAEKLFLSQPALSQRLKKLEEELGAELFRRENAGLAITDAGRVYINGGRSILQIKQEALKQLAGMGRNSRDAIRFGCATSHALECVPRFQEAYPHIELSSKRTNSLAAKEDLIMGRLDIAVLLTPTLQHSILEYLPLSQNHYLLSIPATHPANEEKPPFAQGYDCLKDDYFILSPSHTFSREIEDRALAAMGIQPRILCEIGDNESKRYMLNKNLGNAFLPNYSIQQEDTFRTYPLQPPQTFYIVAAYPKNIVLSEPMKYMLEILLTIFDTAGEKQAGKGSSHLRAFSIQEFPKREGIP